MDILYPSKQETLSRCMFNAVPALHMVGQWHLNSGSTSHGILGFSCSFFDVYFIETTTPAAAATTAATTTHCCAYTATVCSGSSTTTIR